MRPAMTSGGMAGVETPDRPVVSTPMPGGKTTFPFGPSAPPAPVPGAPNAGATNYPLPNTTPLPARPDDCVRDR
jgi:hypothetical protein